MATNEQRAPRVAGERTNLHPQIPATTTALEALAAFTIDGAHPFDAGLDAGTDLQRQAYGMLMVLATAWGDNHTANAKGIEPALDSLNGHFIASALEGVGSLIGLSMFLQEQRS